MTTPRESAHQTTRDEITAPGSTLELTTTLTAEQVDARSAADVADGGTGAITLTGVRWHLFEQIHLVDGIVLTTADGTVYLGRLQDDDPDRAELTIELT